MSHRMPIVVITGGPYPGTYSLRTAILALHAFGFDVFDAPPPPVVPPPPPERWHGESILDSTMAINLDPGWDAPALARGDDGDWLWKRRGREVASRKGKRQPPGKLPKWHSTRPPQRCRPLSKYREWRGAKR